MDLRTASELSGETITPPGAGGLTAQEVALLMRPFDWFRDIEYKPGDVNSKGDTPTALCLAYVNADTVIRRLNEVVPDWEMLEPKFLKSDANGAVCQQGFRVKGTIRYGIGMASRDDKEVEKAAHSDAIKRTARMYGIGWYLTALESVYILCDLKQDGEKFLGWKNFVNPASFFQDAYPLIVPGHEITDEALRPAKLFLRSGKIHVPKAEPPRPEPKGENKPSPRTNLTTSERVIPPSMADAIDKNLSRTGITEAPGQFDWLLKEDRATWSKRSFAEGKGALDYLVSLPNKEEAALARTR